MDLSNPIIREDEPILVTGAAGFVGGRVVRRLLQRGFKCIRCFARPTSAIERLEDLIGPFRGDAEVSIVTGDLLSRDDCVRATLGIRVVYHLAVGSADKSFAGSFLNSVVTTRNLIEAILAHGRLRRFVNVGSFAVYANRWKSRRGVLDESCPVEQHPELRGEAYCFAKAKQDEMVFHYGRTQDLPFVIVRPGVVYGEGRAGITGRVGVGTFGLFLHIGGGNTIPLTYVDNCAEAIVLAGLVEGVDGEIFNVVDDDLPSSRQFLSLYKRNVRYFRSVYVPHFMSYFLCAIWEAYSNWSRGQLPPVFNRRAWHTYWKRTRYSNHKIKIGLGWKQTVATSEGLSRFWTSCRKGI